MSFRFYLSGGMEFKANLGIEWRDWLTAELDKMGNSTLDPTKIEQDENITGPVQLYLTQMKLAGKFDEVRTITRTALFRKDMYGIQLSDAMVMLYDESVQKGAGTLAEGWEAFREGRPIYLVSDFPLDRIPSWLIAETTEMFSNFEDFLVYVRDTEKVAADITAAKKIAEEVLGGIYPTK